MKGVGVVKAKIEAIKLGSNCNNPDENKWKIWNSVVGGEGAEKL